MSNENSLDFFLEQQSFKNWVLGQNESDCKYWDNWVKENPDQLSNAVLAAQLYTGLDMSPNKISNDEITSEWQKLKARIDTSSSSTTSEVKILALSFCHSDVISSFEILLGLISNPV